MTLAAFRPRLTLLPEPQQRVLRELAGVSRRFVLYGGTAITLRLGHRTSLDFDLFTSDHFQPDALEREIPMLRGAVRSRSEPDTLMVVVDRGGPVTVSFFGGLPLARVADPAPAGTDGLLVASLLDLAATKVKVVQDRAEAKDYVDVARLLAAGISLRQALAAALAVYGPTFNPLVSLKALAYFGDGDLPSVPRATRDVLERAVRDTPVEAIHPLPMSLTLEAIAGRVVWWKPPVEALADRRHFLARVMTSGTFDEVRYVRGHLPPEAFRDVLDHPPAGVFDRRSWAYWNLVFDRDAPDLPRRRLPAG